MKVVECLTIDGRKATLQWRDLGEMEFEGEDVYALELTATIGKAEKPVTSVSRVSIVEAIASGDPLGFRLQADKIAMENLGIDVESMFQSASQ